MKLNLGCGFKKLDGFVNVDSFAECDPDVVCDLETAPWPWESDSVDEIVMFHALEHMGADTGTFFAIIKELYRVCRGGALIRIAVPHPRHESFIGDPTHVRIITPGVFALFSKRNNLEWKAMGASNSPLALYLHVDFEVRAISQILEEPYGSQRDSGALSQEALDELITQRNNVISEYRMVLEVIK